MTCKTSREIYTSMAGVVNRTPNKALQEQLREIRKANPGYGIRYGRWGR